MARLRLYLDGQWTATLVLGEQVTRVGRDPDCGLVLSSKATSREHFRITPDDRGAGYRLEDLGSENGTFVNGVREYRRLLAERCIIQAGEEIVLFEPDSEEAGRPANAALPFWAQRAIQKNPALTSLRELSETRHVAPAVHRRHQAEQRARLKPHLLHGEGDAARIFPLDAQVISIGYGEARVSLGPGKTSVLAEVERDKAGYTVRAKGLLGKIEVDGQARARLRLHPGDSFRVDGHLLRFEAGPDEG